MISECAIAFRIHCAILHCDEETGTGRRESARQQSRAAWRPVTQQHAASSRERATAASVGSTRRQTKRQIKSKARRQRDVLVGVEFDLLVAANVDLRVRHGALRVHVLIGAKSKRSSSLFSEEHEARRMALARNKQRAQARAGLSEN